MPSGPGDLAALLLRPLEVVAAHFVHEHVVTVINVVQLQMPHPPAEAKQLKLTITFCCTGGWQLAQMLLALWQDSQGL